MATISDIRAGLAANLAAVGGLQVNGYFLSNPTPPAVEMILASVDYDQTMGRGHDNLTMTVRGFCSLSTDLGAQQELDRWINPSGPKSFKQALESDATLGGVVDDLRVTDCSGYTLFLREGFPPVLGAEWTVEILAPGE